MSVFPARLVRCATFRPLVISLTLAIVLSILMPIIGVIAVLVIATGAVLVLIDVTMTATQVRLSGSLSNVRADPDPLSTRSVLDALAEHAIVGTDLTGLIDVCNSGAATMFGLSAAEVEGLREITDFLVPHDRSQKASFRSSGLPPHLRFGALVESAGRGQAETRQWSCRAESGAVVPVALKVCPRMDESANLVGYTFLARDYSVSGG